jgi:peptide deformylase
MKILKFPHPFLFQPTRAASVFGEELKVLLDDMWNTLKEKGGMGLAANQVGLPLSMFVMAGPEGRINMVNPEIMSRSKMCLNMKEGCLSSPGEFVTIPTRAQWVNIMYKDENGKDCVKLLKDMYAVCAQHEIDHLLGISFMDHKSIPKSVRNGLKKRWGIK